MFSLGWHSWAAAKLGAYKPAVYVRPVKLPPPKKLLLLCVWQLPKLLWLYLNSLVHSLPHSEISLICQQEILFSGLSSPIVLQFCSSSLSFLSPQPKKSIFIPTRSFNILSAFIRASKALFSSEKRFSPCELCPYAFSCWPWTTRVAGRHTFPDRRILFQELCPSLEAVF